jgi:hypothetical protein
MHACANARACKQAKPLPTADREQGVDRTHPGIEHFTHGGTVHGVDRRPAQGQRHHVVQCSLSIQWHAVRIDHSTQQAIAHR